MERFAGRYLLIRRLGQGGMGEVYLARDLSTGNECALKRMRRTQAPVVDGLKREFEALARLRHPAIVGVLDHAVAPDGTPYLTMEYVAGVAADRAVTRGDWRELCRFAARVAAGLEALHEARVAHGDLKPSNVLVVRGPEGHGSGDVRLVDFGLAAFRERNEPGHRGTPGYAAPEVVRGEAPGPAADLYGLGALLVALATGKPPFDSEGAARTLELQRAGAPRALALENSGMPWPLIELTLHLLAPVPAERPAGAREVRLALERLAPEVRVPLAERLRAVVRVGRERELARIEQWMAPRSAGPAVAFVAGPPGIGVSTLLREVAARATLADRAVVTLSAAALDGPAATARAVLRVLAAGAAGESGDAARRLLGADAPPDAAALGEWAAAARACTTTAAPAIVVLDDADHLDDWSAAWLLRVAMLAGSPAPLWLLGHPHPRGDDRWRVLLESANAIEVALGPLDDPKVASLVAARLGVPAPPDLLEAALRHGGGHPGLTVERLRAWAERGALVEDEHGVRLRPDVSFEELPTDFELSRLARLAQLGAAEHAVAEALAVAGTALTVAELERFVPEGARPALDALVDGGFAVRDGERARLHPAALAVPILERVDAARRETLHRTALALAERTARQRFEHRAGIGDVAGALAEAERAFASEPDPRLAARAAELAEESLSERAAEWHGRAAEQLRRRGRYAPMIPHLDRALALESAPARRGALEVARVVATLRTGDPRCAIAIATRALEGTPSPGDRAHLLANRAAAHLMTGATLAAERDAREALDVAEHAANPGAEGLSAEVLLGVANAAGRLDEAEAWCNRAAAAFQHDRGGLGLARVQNARAWFAVERGDGDEALRRVDSAIENARELESRLALTELLLRASAVRARVGRWPEARAAAAEALRLSVEDGRGVEAAGAATHLAQCDALLGRPRAALLNARRAIRLTRRHQPIERALAWLTLAQAHQVRGRTDRAVSAARRALELANPELGMSQWCRLELARALAARGHWQEASGVLDAGDSGASDPAAATLRTLGSARAALRRGDLEQAGRRRSDAEAWLARHRWPWYLAYARLTDAELAFVRRKPREAMEHAAAALASFAQLPAPAERARAVLDLVRLATPSADTREAMTTWLDESARTFERLGDHRGRARALSHLVEWMRAAPAPAVFGRDRGLFERVTWLLNSLTDIDELLRRAMRAAVEQLDAERGVLLLFDPDNGQITPVAEHGGVEASTRQDAMGYSRRVVQRVTSEGDSLLVLDADSDPRASSESIQDMRLRSILCVPLFVNGRTMGAVYLDDSRRSHAFAEADRGMIEGFAHLVAVAIEKSRFHAEVKRENERLEGENLSLRREVGARVRWQGVVGTSAAMQDVLVAVENAARTNTTVLITGENGTGKELIARTLHRSGKRAMGPFVAVNCGAIPETLLESELFGILPNVATGVRGRPGKFTLADKGTLFLDEVGEMPLKQQVALLRVLQEREVTPVGGGRAIPVDVRIVAATNTDLPRLVEEGRFREDLYYRLNVFEVKVPPLRERKADIPALTRHFVELFSRQQEREAPKLSPDFFAVLMRSDWPGNVRELQNYVERLIAMCSGGELRPDPPPRDLNGMARVRHARLTMAVGELEQKLILEALDRAAGNQSQAARELGMPEQSLRYRLRKYGLGARRIRRTRRS